MKLTARVVIAALAVLAVAGAGAAQAATPTWQVAQPPPVGGGAPAPLGAPAALQFIAPNRGVLETGGSGGNPAGIWTYNGQSWTLLANVCGPDTTGEFGGIAFAGKDEFWTISNPAPNPLATSSSTTLPGGQPDRGTTLCHFQNGRVVGSYAVPPNQAETYLPMRAAACLSPTDCWFGGEGGNSGDGLFSGSFHLHWDGSKLTEVWSPQDRAVSSMAVFGGSITQTSVLGPQPFHQQAAQPAPADNDTQAPLVQVLTNGQFVNDPYVTPPGASDPQNGDNPPIVPAPNSKLQQVDIWDAQASLDGSQLWIAGGSAESGGTWGDDASCCGGNPNPYYWSTHYPFLAVRELGGPLLPLTFSGADMQSLIGPAPGPANYYNAQKNGVVFTSVAPIPGSPDEVWVGYEWYQYPGKGLANINSYHQTDNPRLLEVKYDPSAPAGQPNATIVQDVTPAQAVGDPLRLACPAANDCWAATTSGWLLHWTDGTQLPVDTDSAYSQLISIRPPDGRSPQPVATGDAFDDSDLYEPQPLPLAVAPPAPPPPPAPVPPTKHIGVLIRDSRSRAVGEQEIEVSFELMRPARIGLEGLLHGREVAHTAERRLIPGDQRLFLKVRPGWRPQQLKFLTKELALEAPTLKTRARRTGARTVNLTVSTPGKGRLSVRFSPGSGRGAHGSAFTRHVTVSASHKLTTRVVLPAALARGALVARFAFTASPRQSGVPASLQAQRLLAALPSPRKPKKTSGDSR